MMFATAFVGGFCCAIVLVVTQVFHQHSNTMLPHTHVALSLSS
jgi:hypothetical protein